MDFCVDEELNYEEDMPEGDSDSNDLQNKECAEDDLNNKTERLESDDQYLQIDYAEDENLTSDETLLETVTSETEKVEKGIEKKDNSNQENVSSEQKDFNQSKKVGASPFSVKRKKRLRPFPRKPDFNKKTANALGYNPWLPEYNFMDGRNLLTQRGQLMFNNQMLKVNQDFYPILNPALSQLMTIGNTFLQSRSFIPNAPVGMGLNHRSFPCQRRNRTPNLTGQLFCNGRSNFQMDNGLSYQGIEPKFFLKCNGVSNTSIFEQNQNLTGIMSQQYYANNFQIDDSTKKGLLFNPTANSIGRAFDKVGRKKFGENKIQYKSLEEDEKTALKMKKEARLKRFMHDDPVKKDKLSDSGFEENLEECSSPKVQSLETKGQKISLEGQENSLCGKDQEALSGKPDMNTQSRLRKINPFDANVVTTTKAKQIIENVQPEKEECTDTEPWKSLPKCLCQTKMSPFTGCISAPVKTEAETHVKFVRTISKSFDELTSRKPKNGILSEKRTDETLPKPVAFVEADKLACKEKHFFKQLEPQLTGCIVKVLNIPPTTTTNDILALCSSIGIVMEVKFNFPKENSVVIRFAEPTCAENFFSLYHGQKMNNYFLNVIVV